IGGGGYTAVKPLVSTAETPGVSGSTISGNTARQRVGGLFVNNDFVLWTSTIAFNKEQVAGISGAGLYVKGSRSLYNSIIAKNLSLTTGSDFGAYVLDTVSGDHNLIMHANRPVPDDTITADPLLAALHDNGGVLKTHALLPGSPALNHGNSSYPVGYWDGRGPGFRRNVGVRDIGSYEFDPDILFASGFN
ncbi:MAG TPA: choice-of-anchor Q domain-containing protein, partial [Rudaea sp.]